MRMDDEMFDLINSKAMIRKSKLLNILILNLAMLVACQKDDPVTDAENQVNLNIDEESIILSLYPIDSSRTWVQQPSATATRFYDVFFLDASLGWAVAFDTLTATLDGGQNWVQQPYPGYIIPLSVHFTDPMHGWVVGNEGTFLHTEDGGTNWVDQGYSNTTLYSSVQFFNQELGWVSTSDGTVFKTEDGGENWTEYQTGSPLPLDDMHFVNEQVGWVVGYIDAVYKTTDGGELWSKQAPVLEADGSEPDYLHVHFLNDQIGWVAGFYFQASEMHSVLFKTEDGGANWNLQLDQPQYSIDDIFFLDEQQGWIILSENQRGLGFIMTTRDGGESWNLENLSTDQPMSAIHFVDQENGWIVGDNGLILYSNEK
jgi:photosystem II stability/assembly factor-like uncharacterized protein